MTVPEARFCRVCGTPLKASSTREGDAPVSPLAQTIPLTGEGRATDGLGSDEARRAASDTSKVGRAEMENLLRRAPVVQVKQAGDGDGEQDALQTTTLVAEQPAPALDSTPAPERSSAAAAPASAQPSSNASARRMWQALAVALLCIALVAGLLAFILSRRASSTGADESSPISISDQKQLVGEKLAEAETLLASGEFNRAITVLRAAVKLDPTNAEVRMRLGNALERTGARGEAIEEYRAATQSSPNDTAAWRALASAQYEEQLYQDAAESYRRLIEAANENEIDDETRLAYAEALRLAGRTDEARAAYQKISNSASEAIAQTARQHLAELGPPAVAASTERPRDARTGDQQQETVPEATEPSPQPAPQLPSATPTPAVANNEAQVDYDSYYFQAINIVNGRDPKKIERADLLRALALFQRAALGGTRRAEAQRYADKLGKEYDRRRKL